MSPILNHDAGMIHFCQHVMFLWAQKFQHYQQHDEWKYCGKKAKNHHCKHDPANLWQGHEDLWCVQTLTGAVSR